MIEKSFPRTKGKRSSNYAIELKMANLFDEIIMDEEWKNNSKALNKIKLKNASLIAHLSNV